MEGVLHGPGPAAASGSLAKYAWLSVLAAVITIALKAGAWWLTDSVGLLSDAAESLVNLVAAGVTVYALKVAARPPDRDHNFGHSKAEYFSAAIEGQLILIAAVSILFQATLRWMDPRPISEVSWGVAISCLAALINGAVAWKLLDVGRKNQSSALVADGKHLLTDLWTTAGVVLGIIAVKLTGLSWLDPLAAVAVALHILWVGWELLQSSASNLRDRAWEPASRHELVVLLNELESKELQIHSLRTRVSGRNRYVDMHVRVPSKWSVQDGCRRIEGIKRAVTQQFPEAEVLCHLECETGNSDIHLVYNADATTQAQPGA